MYVICVTNTMRLEISMPNEKYCKFTVEVTIQTTGNFLVFALTQLFCTFH